MEMSMEDTKEFVEEKRDRGSESSSSDLDGVDTTPGCEVSFTQTTKVTITEQKPVKSIHEGQRTQRSRSSSAGSDGKKRKRKSSSSESDGYSSGSSSEGHESRTREFSEVERQERFETVEKESFFGRHGAKEVTAYPEGEIPGIYNIDLLQYRDVSGKDS